MSESTIPFQGQTSVLDAPTPDPVEKAGNRTVLIAIGGLALVLVLGAVAYFLLAGGEAESDGAPAPTPGAAAPAAPGPAPSVQPAPEERLSAKSFGRDPFKPLIVEPVAAVAPTGTTAGTSTTGTTGGDATGGSSGDSTSSGTTGPGTSQSHTFRVVEVAPDNSTVTVKVDGETYRNLEAGEVFATYFKVRLITGSVNSFQYGEETFNVAGTKKITIA